MRKGLITIFLMILFSGFTVEAKQISFEIKNGNLVIFEVKEISRIPNVPAGISAETAYKLVTGRIKEWKVIAEKPKRTTYHSLFPVWARDIFVDRLIKYKEGRWTEESIVRLEEEISIGFTLLLVILPLIGILIGTLIINREANIGMLRLFYLCIVASILLAVLAGALTGEKGGVVVGGVGGVVAGWVMYFYSVPPKLRLALFTATTWVALFAAICIGALAGWGEYRTVGLYLSSLGTLMGASLLITQVTQSKKLKDFQIKRP